MELYADETCGFARYFVVYRFLYVEHLDAIDPLRYVGSIAFHADADGIPVFQFPDFVDGFGRPGTNTDCHTLSDQSAVTASLIEFDLIGGAFLGRTQKYSAVATPSLLHLKVKVEVAIFLVCKQQATSRIRLLLEYQVAVLNECVR